MRCILETFGKVNNHIITITLILYEKLNHSTTFFVLLTMFSTIVFWTYGYVTTGASKVDKCALEHTETSDRVREFLISLRNGEKQDIPKLAVSAGVVILLNHAVKGTAAQGGILNIIREMDTKDEWNIKNLRHKINNILDKTSTTKQGPEM